MPYVLPILTLSFYNTCSKLQIVRNWPIIVDYSPCIRLRLVNFLRLTVYYIYCRRNLYSTLMYARNTSKGKVRWRATFDDVYIIVIKTLVRRADLRWSSYCGDFGKSSIYTRLKLEFNSSLIRWLCEEPPQLVVRRVTCLTSNYVFIRTCTSFLFFFLPLSIIYTLFGIFFDSFSLSYKYEKQLVDNDVQAMQPWCATNKR